MERFSSPKQLFYSEIEIDLLGEAHRVFLQPGFFPGTPKSTAFHRHGYTEIHLVFEGETAFALDRETYTAKKGEALLLPPMIYHHRTLASEGCATTSFLIDIPLSSPATVSLPLPLLDAFAAELDEVKRTENMARLPQYLSLILSHVRQDFVAAHGVKDYRALIQEFFYLNHAKDVHMSDLTAALHLSTRQTERLFKEYTGSSFRAELSNMRLSTAKHLLDTTDMSLKEICEQVGFRSYSGFWRAMRAKGYIPAAKKDDI